MTPNAKAKILVAEDHAVIGEAILRLVRHQKDLLGCGIVNSLAGIFPAIEAHKPDLLLLDIFLKDENATTIILSLVKQFPQLRVLVFSQMSEFSSIESALKNGVHGYVTKDETPQEILTAIRTVLKGEIYLCRKMAARLFDNFVTVQPPDPANGSDRYFTLTLRESQVFHLIGVGKKNTEIAMDLAVSVKTVETHRENIKRKLRVQSAPELVHHAIQWVEGRVPQSLIWQKMKPPIDPPLKTLRADALNQS